MGRATTIAGRTGRRRTLAAACACALALAAGGALAQEAETGGDPDVSSLVPIRPVDPRTAGAFAAVDESAARYCANVADEAAEARFRTQAAALRRLEREIEERIARLEEKRRETEEWLVRREQFLRQAEEGLIDIYARMRPDAAAPQLAIMNDVAAAAILVRLDARAASAILAEMAPDVAARLASIMVGIGTRTLRETSG